MGAYLTSPATAGGGFMGGTNNGGNGAYGYNSVLLVPLVGGSGGGAPLVSNSVAGGNGGAGGGAIRIVSSTSITIAISGNIFAYGGVRNCGLGNTSCGGHGSGGVIHLVAPTVSGGGTLDTGSSNAIYGVVKISATNNAYTGSAAGKVVGPLYNPPLPTAVSAVTVVSVNQVPAPPQITGNAQIPDFVISTMNTVAVNLAAQYVPVGTVVKLNLTSEQGNDASISCSPLAGTLASSTASCLGVAFPQGVTIADIRAVW